MNATHNGWRGVTRNEPCPICSKPDWCGTASDGVVVRCMRKESDRPSNGGWIHRIGDAPQPPAPTMRLLPVVSRRPELDRMARQWGSALSDERLERFAEGLGIQPTGLQRLGLGWTGCAWSFPMRNAERQVVGIRLRTPSGRKFAVRGGKEGCFLPPCSTDGHLLFPEGATDAAALLGLGFDVTGRPSCSGGVRDCVVLAHGRNCVVVADADEPGRRGAEALTNALLPVAGSVRLVVPPAKDVREWIRGGAVREDVAAQIDRAPVRRLQMCEVTR